MLVTVALITAAMFAVGSPSAFAQLGTEIGAERGTVDCTQAVPGAGIVALEGRWVTTPSGETSLTCHGQADRFRNTEAVTFVADCPTPSGQTNPDSGSGVISPTGKVTVTCGPGVGGL
jgi:hypothetical protein